MNSFVNQIKYALPNALRNKIHPRQTHAFCIGTPKSGTTSIAGIFDNNYRSSHEPERVELIELIHKHFNKQVTDSQYINWLKLRDKRIWLDIESNCFLGYRPDLLYSAYPNSKYILSVRNPLSWLDSMLNHTINYPPKSELVIRYWHDIFFQPNKYPHCKYDSALKENAVYSIEAYLRYWSKSITSIIKHIPETQLMILKTKELKENDLEISSFLSIDINSLDHQMNHLNKAPEKYQLLNLVEPEYLDDTCTKFCQDIIDKLDLDRY